MVQYGLPFQDFFRSSDPHAKSKIIRGAVTVLISLLLSLVVVGLLGWFILAGYGLRLLRNVQNGEAQPLPEWDQNREDLNWGFKLFVVGLVWSIPGIVIAVLMSLQTLPVFTANIVSILWSLFVALVTPVYCIRMAQPHSNIADGLQFEEIVRWAWNHLGQVFPVVVAIIVVELGMVLASLLGVLALVIGLLVTVPLAVFVTQLYSMHLYGQLARASDTVPLA